jgi:hypothetical protein
LHFLRQEKLKSQCDNWKFHGMQHYQKLKHLRVSMSAVGKWFSVIAWYNKVHRIKQFSQLCQTVLFITCLIVKENNPVFT